MTEQGEPLVRLTGVGKAYPAPEGQEGLRVLRGIDLTIAHGASLAILGPSGCGKTTLLNLIGTLDRPTEGEIELEGRSLTGRSDDELAAIRNRRMGFVFQRHHLLPHCTAMENVLVPTLARSGRSGAETGASDEPVEERARRLLDRVGLSARAGHPPSRLSGGECQRVAVVRALINRPALLLADEPTGALDGKSAEDLMALLVELNAEEGVTLVVVTHATGLAGLLASRFELRAGVLREVTS